MKRRNWTIYIMAFFAWMLASCSEELEPLGADSATNARAFTLQLKAAGATTEEGEDIYNENVIKNVSVFFFEDTQTAKCAYLKRNIPFDNQAKKLVVPLDETFQPGEYFIFLVANAGYHTEDVTQYTLPMMKQRLVYTQFETADKEESSFMMQGLTEKVSVKSGGKGGEVTLKRLAAKVVLLPTVTSPITVDGVEYTAELGRMDVALHSIANYAHVGGTELTQAEYDQMPQADKEKAFSTSVPRSYKNVAAQGVTPVYAHIPFYSYPTTWKAYVDGTGIEDTAHQTYLTFRIPWTCTKNGVQLSTNYYYRVPITNEIDEVHKTRSLKSNTLYKIHMKVGVLGSIDPGQVTPEVELKYEISDWKSVGISAEVNKYAYLELEANHVEMNNESRADIGLASSSDVTAKVVKVTYPDYSRETISQSTMTEQDKPVEPNKNDRKYWGTTIFGKKYFKQEVWDADWKKYQDELKEWNSIFATIEPYGQTLVFQHELPSTVYVPWTYTIKVTNNDGLEQTLTITQYPPIYITGENNANGSTNRFVYGKTTNETWVGGGWDGFYTVIDDSKKSLGGANDLSNATNKNKNQYTIHVTQLDAGANYIIGDPRNQEPIMLSDLTKYGNPKGLQRYLKTKGELSSEREVDRMIAPVFKIASSWGVVTTGSIDYVQAQKRCASYQENGYPAGRWRIPTEGEIEFIVSLSNMGYIPKLFGGDYYASSKRYFSGGNEGSGNGFNGTYGTDTGNRSVRCIYDVWYWGDEKLANPNVFTWGDTDPIRPAK